jgi:5-methylcytosine-specific restriction endonuclease McrA
LLVRQPKPIPQRVLKARKERAYLKARKECLRVVWLRAGSRCQRCGRGVLRPERTSGWEPWTGQVNELTPRSRGGDPLDPENCELVCKQCHFGGPSGAHAPTADRMVKR